MHLLSTQEWALLRPSRKCSLRYVKEIAYDIQLRDMATRDENSLQILRWFSVFLRVTESKCSILLFHLKTKYKCLCECSQTFLHLENYGHQQAVALFLVNCIASILPLCKFSSQFLECSFWSSLKTIQSF